MQSVSEAEVLIWRAADREVLRRGKLPFVIVGRVHMDSYAVPTLERLVPDLHIMFYNAQCTKAASTDLLQEGNRLNIRGP